MATVRVSHDGFPLLSSKISLVFYWKQEKNAMVALLILCKFCKGSKKAHPFEWAFFAFTKGMLLPLHSDQAG
ncbi:MAG: hypothetical protein E7449_05755 [Ruminococcaceae bacterium]|nr:hypothetical protein [Oscillospiraceae bacterium]